MSRRKRFDDEPIDAATLEQLVNVEDFEEVEFWISGVDLPAMGDDDGKFHHPFYEDDELPF